ncbi:1-acyl-sn-glycerol-3-phosphate acyltransferase epsilon isoform X2 [Callithrix jacchus]|uniref:1-acyl-sn-glycerol-3-phosphate acyltransferase epsilon isoform X2 n=1 Tax=Callithrix jacchus TaxID=9483 RepID=UPI0004F0B406|nr:1-acyl-sn-glycerol-3-phosphate acyltransferase epsilon isoform X2 [Callithrix jacchus]
MLLSLVLHTYSMRYLLPSVVLLGTAPTYVLAWGVWRLLSAFLPSRFYQALDDRLYCVYQSMVLFFFENYTGVQKHEIHPCNWGYLCAITMEGTRNENPNKNVLLGDFRVLCMCISILLYGDLPKNKENIIYLANHRSTVDWIVADILAIRQNALGHVRYVLKDGLKWLPLYGCYFSQHGGIYVKRSAKFNEKEMRNKLQSYVDAGTPMYLVIFPEGTRYNPEQTKVISSSQAFAAQRGLPVLKYVLTPRIKATHVAFDCMKKYLDAIYDVTVVYEGKDNGGQQREAPTMTEFLCKESPKIHIHIDRIDKKDVPEEQERMRRWLHERFEIKDKMLIEFYESPDPERRNRFPGKSVHSKLSMKKTLPSMLILSGLTTGMLMTEAGRKLYVNTWIYGTLLGCLWITIKP